MQCKWPRQATKPRHTLHIDTTIGEALNYFCPQSLVYILINLQCFGVLIVLFFMKSQN